MAITCVAATGKDLDTLLAMMRELYVIEGSEFDDRRQRPALVRLLGDEMLGRAYLIRDGDRTAGYVFLTFDYGLEYGGREVWIDELFVREGSRGRGFGAAALRFVEEVCRSWGVRAIHLGVARTNPKALDFYLKNGFGEPERYMLTKVLPGEGVG